MRTPEAAPRRRPSVWKGLALAGSLVAALLAAPAAATAAPLTAEDGSGDCTVESVELRWGIKESFRSYISGSIANGEWTVSDDMRYETPDFIWDQSRGQLEGSLASGAISFRGAVHFTGHDGALQFDLSDPAVEFDGEDTAYLALTIGSTDQGESAEVAPESVRVAKLDLSDALSSGGAQLGIDGAVPVLTSEGAATFNGEYGSYVAGDELDPIFLTATVGGCELGDAAPAVTDEPEAIEPIDAPVEAEQSIPWLPIIIGGVAILVIGVTVGMLVAGRKRPSTGGGAESGDTGEPGQPE